MEANNLANKDSVWAPSEMVCDGVNYAYLVGPAVPEFNTDAEVLTQRAAAIAYFKETIPAELLLPVGAFGATPEEINTEYTLNIKINTGILMTCKSDKSILGLFTKTGEMTELRVEKIIPARKVHANTLWVDLALIPCLEELTDYTCHIDWNKGVTLNKQIGFAIDGDKL